MAKKKENSLNQNFEVLKAQMEARRRLAEKRFDVSKTEKNFEKEDSENAIADSQGLNDRQEISKDDSPEEEYVTLNIVEDDKNEESNAIKEESDNTMIEEEKSTNKETQVEYVAKKTGVVSDININKIVIKKIDKPEMPKRITYYLRPETIKKIDKFSKASGMGKSEFVQKILDEVLNNLEIEK